MYAWTDISWLVGTFVLRWSWLVWRSKHLERDECNPHSCGLLPLRFPSHGILWNTRSRHVNPPLVVHRWHEFSPDVRNVCQLRSHRNVRCRVVGSIHACEAHSTSLWATVYACLRSHGDPFHDNLHVQPCYHGQLHGMDDRSVRAQSHHNLNSRSGSTRPNYILYLANGRHTTKKMQGDF